jgi:hypothetical protein
VSRAWEKEWSVEDRELDDLLQSLAEFNACDHEWRPATEADMTGGEGPFEVCDKCGGGQMQVTGEEFEAFKEALENGRKQDRG